MRRFFLLLSLIALPASAAVTGIVITDDGAPVAGARVRAFARVPFGAAAARLLSNAPDAAPLAASESAANGTFSVDTKGNAAVDVIVDVAGREPAVLTAADGDDAGAVALHAAASRRVKVTADGKAVPNALVYMGRSLVVRTDAQGTFPAITATEPWFIIHPDYAIAGVDRGGEMPLSRGAALRGRVVGRDGTTPVAGALISLGGWPMARSGDDGKFTIAHAPSKLRMLLAVSGNDAGAATADPSKPVEIRLGTAASLSGSVTSKGAPVAGAIVAVLHEIDRYSAITDSQGRYAIAALPPGNYNASIVHPAYAADRAANVRVAGATARSFTLQARPRVRGTVVTEDKKPAAGAFVSATGGDGSAGFVVLTGSAGEFSLRAMSAGTAQRVIAGKSGYAMAMSPPLTLAAGETKSGVALTLQRGFPMKIKVADAGKEPVAEAAVEIAPAGESGRRTSIPCSITDARCRYTGADGMYQIQLVEGTYDVHVTGEFVPRTLAAQALAPRVSPLTVIVERGAEVSGRVLFADGTPVADARVMVRGGSGSSVMSDANGAFTLKRLPRAAAALMAMTMDETPLQSPVVDVTPPARNVTITMPTPSSIEGRVVDRATSQPVTSFNVQVLHRGGFQGRGVDVNKDDGTFVLPRVQPGTLELVVTAPSYVAGTVTDLMVEQGKALTGVEVKLDRGARVTGHVTAGGKAVAGAMVAAGARLMRGRAGRPATTDDNGEYSLDGVPAGAQTIDFTKDGFVPKRKDIEVTAGKDATVDVELDRGREIHGRVTDKGGQGVAGARIAAHRPMQPRATSATSDDNGQFTISGLEDGRYSVSAQKNGYVGATVDDVDPAAGQQVTLTLDQGGTITGRVTGVPEAELPMVRVSASARNSNSTQQVDASGAFTLTGIPDGRITVTAYKYGAPMRQAWPKTVEVVSGSAPPVEIDFGAGISIRGRVTRNGAPVSGGSVSFIKRDLGRVPTGIVGPDGSYEVTGVEPGDYDVRVNVAGGGNDALKYTVTGNATFDIDLHGGAVRGTVVDAATGAPLPDARVYTVPGRDSRTFRSAATDSDGRFVLDLVPDGTIDVRAERERYAPLTQTISVTGGSAPPLELRLTHGLEAVIRIIDAGNSAPLDGTVMLLDAQRKSAGVGSGRGEDGATHVWAAEGRYTAIVRAPGYLQQNADVVVPGPTITVALTRAARLVITSRSGGLFTILPATLATPGAGGGITSATSIRVPAGERMSFESLAPGVYEVRKMAADGKTAAMKYSVVLTAGQTATLDAD